MKYSEVVQSIIYGYQTRLPLMILGAPGIGKSAAVRDAAQQLGIDLRDERASQTDPVDWRGLPSLDTQTGLTRWLPPASLPTSGSGILFLDELNAAPMAVQVALYQLTLDRKIGDYTLPNGWYVVAAGNRAEDRAAATRMSSALANRFVHLEMTVDVDGWLDWYWAQDLPEEVGFYIGFRREALHRFDPVSKDLAFPTPRSWASAARLYAQNLPPAIEHQLIAGCVGTGAAAEFLAFCKIYRELPSLDGILLDPENSQIPATSSAVAAVVAGLAKRAAPSNIGAILKYVARTSKEFEFLCTRLARQFCPSVEQTRDMAAWMARNSRFLISQ